MTRKKVATKRATTRKPQATTTPAEREAFGYVRADASFVERRTAEIESARWDAAFVALADARATLYAITRDESATTEEREIAKRAHAAVQSATLVLRPGGLDAARKLAYGATEARTALGFADPREMNDDAERSMAHDVRQLITTANGIAASELAQQLAFYFQPPLDVEWLAKSIANVRQASAKGVVRVDGLLEHQGGSTNAGNARCECSACVARKIVRRAIKLAYSVRSK